MITNINKKLKKYNVKFSSVKYFAVDFSFLDNTIPLNTIIDANIAIQQIAKLK